MKITILEQKYKVGCGKGLACIERLHILTHLNTIIEWSKCEWPTKKEKVEVENLLGEKTIEERDVPNKDFLGSTPELSPGNVFEVNGQVIAVDSEDRLVLIVSRTGPASLERVWTDMIEPEIDMIFNNYDVNVNSWERASKKDIPDDFEPVAIPYNIYKIWKDHFLAKEGIDDSDNLCIKTEVESADLFMPVEIYFLKWKVYVRLDDYMDENHVKDIVKQAISWFYEYS